MLNPEVIFIGGGVSSAWEMFIGPTLEQVEKRAFQRPYERVKIVRGQLGDDAGILGAAKTVIARRQEFFISRISRSINYGRLPQSLDKTV